MLLRRSTANGPCRASRTRAGRLAGLLASAALLMGVGVAPAHAAFGDIAKFGSFGTGTGQFPFIPRSIASDAATGRLYVEGFGSPDDTSTPNDITVYSREGAFVSRLAIATATDQIVASIAVDGPRKRLYALVLSPGSGVWSVQAYNTDNLAAAPTTFIPEAPAAPTGGAWRLAVDQSTDAALGGRVFVAFNSTVDPSPDTAGGYVNEYSPSGAKVRQIGSRAAGTGDAPLGQFARGEIYGIAVAGATHQLVTLGGAAGDESTVTSTRIQRFDTSGAVVAGSALTTPLSGPSPFAVAPDGSVYLSTTNGGETAGAPLQKFSSTNQKTQQFGGVTTVAGTKCRWYADFVSVVGANGDLYVASDDVSNDGSVADFHAQITRLGAGGTGCGLDPVVDTATVDEASPTVGQTITISATGHASVPGAITYDWDLDGNPATGTDGFEVSGPSTSQTVAFATAGIRTIRVRIRDADGAPAPAVRSLDIAVRKLAPVAKFVASATSVTAGAAVAFDAGSSTASDPISRYEWDFGDGFTTDGGGSTTISKVFSAAGSYRVRVRITAGGVTANSATQTITVASPAPPAVVPPLAPAPPAATPAPKPGLPLTTVATVAVGSSLKGSVKKGLSLAVSCAAGGATCTGTVTLTGTVKRKTVVFARVAYSFAAGKRGTVVLKLKSAGKKALAKAKSAKATVLVTPTGGKATTKSVKLKLSRR